MRISSIALKPTHEYEIIEIIIKSNDRKSTGFIDIPVRLIKHSKFIIAHFVLISKICASFQGQCLRKRVTCLFLSPVLVFDFLVEKIGYCGREDLFFWSSPMFSGKTGLC